MNPEKFIEYWGTRRLALNRMFNILTSNYTISGDDSYDEEGDRQVLNKLQDFLLTHEGQLPLNLSKQWNSPPRIEKSLIYTSPLGNMSPFNLQRCLQNPEGPCGFFRNAALSLEGSKMVSPREYTMFLGSGSYISNIFKDNWSQFTTWENRPLGKRGDFTRGLELEFSQLLVRFADLDEQIPFSQLEQERWAGGRDWTQDMGPWMVEEDYCYLMFTYQGDSGQKTLNFPQGLGGVN